MNRRLRRRVLGTVGTATVALPFWTGCAFAGTISIRSAIQAERQGDALLVSVELANAGDEPAHLVQARLEAAGMNFAGGDHPLIAPGAGARETWRVPLAGKPPGRHPILLWIHYSDANGYPFTALASAIVSIDRDVAPQVAARFSEPEVSLAGNGRARLELANLAEQELALSVRLVGPRELRLSPGRRRFALVARQRRELELELENLSALPGSRYPIFAVVEHGAELHHTVIAQGWVEIGARRSWTPGLRYLIYGALLLLAAWMIWGARRSIRG